MLEISSKQRHQRMRAENPWWAGGEIRDDYRNLKPRAYFERFARLVEETSVHRAVVLMGPRRVGKTVLLHHVIERLLDSEEYKARDIGYISLDHPLYTRLSIEDAAVEIRKASRNPGGPRMLILDEIQYLADWKRHLKAFVDAHPSVKCVVSGSAAAALRLKSVESGAGRFTDFLLPPLTFHEFLDLQGIEGLVEHEEPDGPYAVNDIEELNRHFVDYVNFGGYPEAVSSPAIRSDPARYIGTDIVEKVLLRDLPSLYGIQDVQELNALFMTLAYNTAEEVSLEALSRQSGVTKPTLRRYLEFLEASFLIKVIHRIDDNARSFKRATRFKAYVTTPALHCALFGPVAEDDPEMGPLAETAVFAQWFHSETHRSLRYARWQGGEVDLVHLDRRQRPDWGVEVKWSDGYLQRSGELSGLTRFTSRHPRVTPYATTRTHRRIGAPWLGEGRLDFIPTSLYCYMVGENAIRDPSPDAPWIALPDDSTTDTKEMEMAHIMNTAEAEAGRTLLETMEAGTKGEAVDPEAIERIVKRAIRTLNRTATPGKIPTNITIVWRAAIGRACAMLRDGPWAGSGTLAAAPEGSDICIEAAGMTVLEKLAEELNKVEQDPGQTVREALDVGLKAYAGKNDGGRRLLEEASHTLMGQSIR